MHKRILQFQENCYHWNLKVHTNLKMVVDTVNEVVDAIDDLRRQIERQQTATSSIDQSQAVTQTDGPDKAQTFHEKIMMLSGRTKSREFRDLVTGITASQFSELKEDSLMVILPEVLGPYLQDGKLVPFSLVYAYETMVKWPEVLSKPEMQEGLTHLFRLLRSHRATGFEDLESPALRRDELETLFSWVLDHVDV